MTQPTKAAVLQALRAVAGPDGTGNIVDLGLVSEVVIANAKVYFAITVPAEAAAAMEPLRQKAESAAKSAEGVESANAVLTSERPAGQRQPAPARPAPGPKSGGGPPVAPAHGGGPRPKTGVPGIKHIIAVASGKGGVGKSTTAVNLALALRSLGNKVGILDADVYGPSLPRLMGLSGRPQVIDGKTMRPLEGYGIKVMSIGFLVDEGTPVIWRGPMVMSALTQMLREVAWGELDVLVVDMPPGTGDAQLSMAQQVPLAGAVIVSTPQDLALIDARKGLAMFQQVAVPVLGIVENMSFFLCPSCGSRSDIFGHGGARAEADRLGVPFLGEVPLHMEIREKSDLGMPVVATSPESGHAQAFIEIAKRVAAALSAGTGLKPAPRIVIQ